MLKRNNIKYISLALITFVCFHWVLSIARPKSSYSKSWTRLSDSEFNGEILLQDGNTTAKQIGEAKACFIILLKNENLHDFRWTMRQLEDRFNHKYNYPYVFLSNTPFSEEFKKLTSALTKAKTEYGLIPSEHWSMPNNIDMEIVRKNMEQMKSDDVLYGDDLPYRYTSRFESGFFFRHELLDKYDYYWRVKPGVEFFCNIDFDPFMYLKENDIKYGFTISLYEYPKTIPTLWSSVKEFMEMYPEYIEKDNLIDFISNDKGESFNLCHFWSNFEIGDLNLWRSEAFMKFFDFLDNKGGFFYERWGDAAIHSIAVALFLKKHQVHFFNEIGYKHSPFMHCPADKSLQLKCHCNPDDSFDFQGYSCTPRFLQFRKYWREIAENN